MACKRVRNSKRVFNVGVFFAVAASPTRLLKGERIVPRDSCDSYNSWCVVEFGAMRNVHKHTHTDKTDMQIHAAFAIHDVGACLCSHNICALLPKCGLIYGC